MKFCEFVYLFRYTSDKNLPGHLKPNAITTSIGLKTRVVRSLFYSYGPFVESIAHKTTLTHIPLEKVEGKTCQCYWWKQAVSTKQNTPVWILYLKMSKTNNSGGASRGSIFDVGDHELIDHNPEEECCMLRITALSFMNIQDITGLYLRTGSFTVSRDFLHHKVKLDFYTYRKNGIYVTSQARVLCIDPVLDVCVLPWWGPEYPHPLDN